MTAEEWRPALGLPNYFVSNLGRVQSQARKVPRIMWHEEHTNGYFRVHVWVAGSRVRRYVHQMVAEAFHGARPEGQEVRHLDGDKRNNAASNLQWGTHSENMRDLVDHGAHHLASRPHCVNGHPYDDANTYTVPRNPTARHCRACHRVRNSEYRQRQSFRAAGIAA